MIDDHSGDPRQNVPVRSSWGPLDDALEAYRRGDGEAAVDMRTDVGGSEQVPVRIFFRGADELVDLERAALDLCRGAVLDVGAGAGALSVLLRQRGLDVTATETLPMARRILRDRGVPVLETGDATEVPPTGEWDTVLAMMNGLGLAGSLAGLTPFLERLAARLAPGGRIVADSTDPSAWDDERDGRQPGEVHMQLGFGGRWGDPFPFLFVSPRDLKLRATEAGLATEILATGGDGRYLAILRRTQDLA